MGYDEIMTRECSNCRILRAELKQTQIQLQQVQAQLKEALAQIKELQSQLRRGRRQAAPFSKRRA